MSYIRKKVLEKSCGFTLPHITMFFTKRFLAAREEAGGSFIGEQRINICVRAKKVGRSIKIFFKSSVKIDGGREADGVGNLLVTHVGREK